MPIEDASALRSEIVNLRLAIDRAGCPRDERMFGAVRNNITTLLQDTYGDSLALYVLCCSVVPISICLAVFLLYISESAISEKFMRIRVTRNLSKSPVLKQHLHTRTLSQASSRAARRRILFSVTIKCIIATVVLLGLIGSRVMVLAVVRNWITGFFTSPGDDNAVSNELYMALLKILNTNWMADLQSLFIFSTVGSGAMVLGLRLLRSATDDATSLQSGTVSSLRLLRKMDEQYKAWGQEEIRKQLEELKLLVSECIGAGPEGEELICDEQTAENDTVEEEKDSIGEKKEDCVEKSNEDKERTNAGKAEKEKEEKEDESNADNDNMEGNQKEGEVKTEKLERVDNDKGKKEKVM